MEVSCHHLARPGKESPSHGTGARVGLRGGLDDFEKQENLLSLPGFKSLTVQFEAQFLH